MRTTQRAYDAAGNLITITDPAGHAQRMTYDVDRRLTSRRADDGSQVTFTYDAAGRRTSMTDATGTTHYSYDGSGRLLTVTDPDGEVTAAAYDAAGQRSSLTYPGGLQVTYSYDGNGNLTALHDSRAGDAAYAVDPDGRLLTEQLPGRLARRYRYDHGLLTRFLVIRDGHRVARTTFTHDPDGHIDTQRDDDRLTRYRYDRAGQLTAIIRPEGAARLLPARPQVPGREGERADELAEVHLTYDVLGNRTSLRHNDTETRYTYDAASQLLNSETRGRPSEYRYDSSGRLIEEHDGEHHKIIRYNGLGLPVSRTRTMPGRREHTQATFNGNGLLASLILTDERGDGDEQHTASVRYRWTPDVIPQILSQRAEPHLEDAERDRPGRLNADFAHGYGLTFASWEHGAAAFHTDAFGSVIRTEDTEAWVQADRYDTFGGPEGLPDGEPRHSHSEGPEREHALPGMPELPRFGYRSELALGGTIYLRARTYDARLGRFTTSDPLASHARIMAAVSPYAYASNDPLNLTDPLGLFSLGSVFSPIVHAVQHVARGAAHVVHAVVGTVTRAAHVVAGTVAHAFNAVGTGLANVAAIARKDASIAFHAVHDAAARVVHVVRDAVSRSAGMVRGAVTSAVGWIKKHNQIIGKIGTVLSHVSQGLALAGLVIAPIPGLDALTPVLEGAAIATSLGALAAQGIAKAAGDRNITYGDLFNDALGAIPGGGDAEDAVEGLNTASRITKDVGQEVSTGGGAASVLKGEAGVQQSIAAAEGRGETVIGREITMETAAGRTRPDILTQDSEGNLKFIEAKNGPAARLTPNQKAGYPLLRTEGGVPRGMNAQRAGLTPGEPIGPVPVQVDYWELP
jgi:RHS repeat-associated protein